MRLWYMSPPPKQYLGLRVEGLRVHGTPPCRAQDRLLPARRTGKQEEVVVVEEEDGRAIAVIVGRVSSSSFEVLVSPSIRLTKNLYHEMVCKTIVASYKFPKTSKLQPIESLYRPGSSTLSHIMYLSTSFWRPWSLGNLNLVDYFPPGAQAC